MSGLVVADASPLIFLSRLDLLDLLPEIFDSVRAPGAVLEEIRCGGSSLPGAAEIEKATWLEIPVRGTLGILLDAKRRGLIDELAPYVDKLASVGAWVSPGLVRRVLEAADEI